MAFRSHVNTSHLTAGDAIVIYATRSCWHNPTRDRAQVAAVGRIAAKVVHMDTEVGGETMPQRCDLSFDVVMPERHGIPFADLVGRLALTRGREHWGPLLRRTIVPVLDADVAIIRRECEKQTRHQTSA